MPPPRRILHLPPVRDEPKEGIGLGGILNRLLLVAVVIYAAWHGYRRFFGAKTSRSPGAALSFYRAAVERGDFVAQFAVADPDGHRMLLEDAAFFCALRNGEEKNAVHLSRMFGNHGVKFTPACDIGNFWAIKDRKGFYREMMEYGFRWFLETKGLAGLGKYDLPDGTLSRVVVKGNGAFGLTVVGLHAVPLRAVKLGLFWRIAPDGTVPHFARLWVETARAVRAVMDDFDRLSRSRDDSARARSGVSDAGEREGMEKVDKSMAARAEDEAEAYRVEKLREGWRPYKEVLGEEWFAQKMREL